MTVEAPQGASGKAQPDLHAVRGYLPAVELAPGDRFPNFMLPDQTGATRSFLERAKGYPLLVLGDGRDDALRALAAARSARPGTDALALVGEEPGPAAKRAEALGIDFPLLGDSAGKIREALRRMLGFGPQGSFVVLLDANQRVIAARAGPDGGELVRWAAERLDALPPPPAAQSFAMAAPVLIVPGVLTPEDCRALIDRWERLGHTEGEVHSIVQGVETSRVHRAMKSRRDHSIQDDAVLAELNAVIGRRIAPELDKAFAFQRFRFDRFNITCYDGERGDYFRRHRDNQSPATADRRFALTLNLNTGEYEGGELLFPEYGPYRYNPPTGAAILFSCSLLHEALPVTKGRRFTLLNFLRA
ncbi:MAG TPA: 2OG-Fe(II) oxygenase [Dongiaceae bacterium]|nr:2OG-Fe(II) oxygenase [Dongiaceae bacterium]